MISPTLTVKRLSRKDIIMRTIEEKEFPLIMKMIKRSNYRMKVLQNGGRFIEVKDFDEELRKAEFDKIMYNREMGYSGYDEYNEDGSPV